jgi:uncharacterized protein
MNEKIVDRALEYVESLFAFEYSGHDFFHTLRVYKMATRIAEEEGADSVIVQLAALLHDVDDRKLSPETWEGQTRARGFLLDNGVGEDEMNEICRIIREVSFSVNGSSTPSSIEGRCVQDADRLDAIGAIGIGRAFAYGGSHNRHMHHPDLLPKVDMTREEYTKNESTTINHFYEKLFKLASLMTTKSAIKIAKERENYMKEFLARFLDEWDGVR